MAAATAAARRRDKRAYRMRARAAAAAGTEARIREAAYALFSELPYDAVGLEAVASRAGVSLPTVLRKFGTKEGLFAACAREASAREAAAREVSAGDVRGAVRVLASRYEGALPAWKRHLDLEGRFPAVAQVIARAREDHLAWLAAVFAPYLSSRPGRLRTRRLAALQGATEIYVWWTWRAHLGLDARQAEQAMLELLEALVLAWGKADGEGRAA